MPTIDSKTVVADPVLVLFSRVEVEESSLLGAPMLPGKTLDEAWSSRCADLTRACVRFCLVSSQDALSLLRASFSSPNVQHLLLCSPSVDLVWLDKFDDLLKSSVSSITNNALSETQWLQATLPIKDEGLWIRWVQQVGFLFKYYGSISSLSVQRSSVLL